MTNRGLRASGVEAAWMARTSCMRMHSGCTSPTPHSARGPGARARAVQTPPQLCEGPCGPAGPPAKARAVYTLPGHPRPEWGEGRRGFTQHRSEWR